MKWPWIREGAEIAVPGAREYLDKVSALDHLSRALTYIKRLPDSAEAQRLLMETYRATADAMWQLGAHVQDAQGTEAQRAETVQRGSVHDGPVAESDAP